MTLLLEPNFIPIDPPGEDGGDSDRNGDEPVRWITVATFWSPPEAHLARLKLESEEIDCLVANENIISTDYLLAPAVGGIQISVPEFAANRARGILARAHRTPPDFEPVAFGKCPECGSTRTDRPLWQAKTFWALVVSIMILGPLAPAGVVFYLIMWRPWHCRDCGNTFRRGTEARQGFPIAGNVASLPAVDG